MLKIGEFSVLSQISIYMLRHYDEIGLLTPEQVDKFTGYRYYSENQLPEAGKIRALKSMGLGLSQIKEILTRYARGDELKRYLEAQAETQREQLNALSRQLTLTESTIRSLETDSAVPSYSISIKEIPKHSVVSHRRIIASPDREGELWVELSEKTSGQNVQYTTPPMSVAIFHDEGFTEENLDVEVQKTVTGKGGFKTVEPFTAATLTYKGDYMRLPAANEAIARYISENGYEIAGPRFNIYHVSPETESSFENMVTEVCFPVRRK